MKRLTLLALLTLPLAACTLGTRPATATPVPVVVSAVPGPVRTNTSLDVLDASTVTVTLTGRALTIRLTDPTGNTWLRVLNPDGTVSLATRSPGCSCLGLGATLGSLSLTYAPGLQIETSPTREGPWTLAARTLGIPAR
jgi:hypothetical protein